MAHAGIESVLVAGRGPAACAVIAACSRLDVKTVAVHSEAERSARHVPGPREEGSAPAHQQQRERRAAMSKRGRKRRSRKGNKANHGKRPNA